MNKGLDTLSLRSPAKLNLFLHITGRRSDGYHKLQTLFQLLDFGDDMVFNRNDSGHCSLHIDNNVELNELATADNLVIKAALALQKETGCTQGVDIHLLKRIPMGGGMGGGSSNAATTLLALNQLWQTHLPVSRLAEIGVTLGADVPVFIHGRTAWAEGIGEQLEAVNTASSWFVIIKPNCHVDTGKIFSHKQLTRDSDAITVAAFLEQGGKNDCETVVCANYPEVETALTWLRQQGDARLTGTGACVFASFDSEQDAKAVLGRIPTCWESFLAVGLNVSPVHKSLDIFTKV